MNIDIKLEIVTIICEQKKKKKNLLPQNYHSTSIRKYKESNP